MTVLSSTPRRRFLSATACAALTLKMPAVRAQGRPEKKRLLVSADGIASFTYLPLAIAEQLGFFKDEGLDLQIIDYPDAASAAQAMLAGSSDVCSGSFERTLTMHAKNQMVRAFVLQSRTPQIAFGVSTHHLTTYASIAELRGRKVGVTALDSSASLMTSLLLARAGLNVKDVSLMPVGTTAAALSAIRTGQIDALCSGDPVMTMLEQKGDIKIISDARTLRGTADLFGGSMPSACLYATSDFVLKSPNTCQALTNAIVRSLKWLQTAGPSDIIKAVPESYMFDDRASYLASFNKIRQCFSIDGFLPEDGPLTALKVLSRFDPSLQQTKIDVKKTYTNIFATRSKELFKA